MMSNAADITESLGKGTKGSLHKVDAESLNNLVHEYDKALEDNFERKSQLQKFKDDYLKLKKRLKTMPDKLEYEAMVPICSKALCPGKIIHTNEILVLLGENMFVECTANNAVEIVGRRLKDVDDKLSLLDKERELYNAWKLEAERQMVETLGEGTVEIMEEYDEAKELLWRKSHRERVRSYHQQLAKEREVKSNTAVVNNLGKTQDEEKLWTRLDALELEEEFMEAQALYEEKISGTTTSPLSNKGNTLNETKIRERSRPNLLLDNRELERERNNSQNNSYYQGSGKKVTFSPENIIHNLVDLNTKDSKKKGNKEQEDEQELYKSSESNDNGEYDPIFIRFRHGAMPIAFNEATGGEEVVEELVTSSESDSDDEDDSENYQVVQCPGDIYEQFGPSKSVAVPGADKRPLKSILKGKKEHHNRGSSRSNSNSQSQPSPTIKKALCETASVLAPSVTEHHHKVPNNTSCSSSSRLNDMFPYVQMSSSGQEVVAGAPSNSAPKPVSLFKRMKASQMGHEGG